MQFSKLNFTSVGSTALLVCALAFCSPQQTQAQTRYGLRAGGAAAQQATAPYSRPVGAFAGLYAEKSLSRKAAVRPEFNAVMMRSKYKEYVGTQRTEKTLMQYRIQAPVFLSIEALPHFWVMAGPQLNYTLTELPQANTNPDTKLAVNPPLTLGAAGGIMFRTSDGVELSMRAGYSSGWSSQIPTNTAERITYSVGVGFPISGFNAPSNPNARHSKFAGNSYQIPGE
jgi:hypothetical protein